MSRSPKSGANPRPVARARPALERLEGRDVPAGLFLQGQSYVDANQNGRLDPAEPYLPGAVIELRSQDGAALIASTATNAAGTFRFDDANVPGGLLPGVYRLVEVPAAGYVNTPASNQPAVSAGWPLGPVIQLDPSTLQVTLNDWTTPPLGLSYDGRGDSASLQMTLTDPPPALFPNAPGGRITYLAGELNVTLAGGGLAGPVGYITYCLDLTRPLTAAPDSALVVPRTQPVPPSLAANAGRIAYLYNQYGVNGFPGNAAASALFAARGVADSGVLPPAGEDAAALQLVMWELSYDVGTAARPEGDLEAGNFFFRAVEGQADFATDAASEAVRRKAYAFLQDSLGKSEQAIFLDGTLSQTQLTLLSGSLNFGNVAGASLSGVKFGDTDGDGQRAAGEPGLAGWTIFLDANGNGVLDGGERSTQTAADGSYTFAGLLPGTYRVREVGQTGWVQTTATPGDVTLAAGGAGGGVDFGNFELGRLGGQKFNDLNGDGVKQSGEAGLPGWTIELDRGADGTVDATTTTDASGGYSFTGLTAGVYRVREVGQAGWVQTTVNPGDVNVVSGTNGADIDFGNFQLGEIRGRKFRDADGDGQRAADGSEPGLAGWTIFLDANGNGALDAGEQSTQTAADGSYAFTGLPAGTYRVREAGQGGWVQTTVNPADVAIISGTTRDGVDFGNFEQVGGGVPPPPPPPPPPPGGGGETPPGERPPSATPLGGPGRPIPLVRPAAFAPAALTPPTEASKRALLASTAPARAASVSAIPARLAADDFNRDGVADVVRASGPGMANQLEVIDGATGTVLFEIRPFESSFTGGLLVTTGDLTGDGVPDLLVSPDRGGGPRVVVYSGAGFATVLDVLGVDDPDFRGGARPAVGDVNGDGAADLIVAAGFGGGPRVTVWDGAALRAGVRSPLADFFAFEPTLRDGAYVATGDVDGDGFDDLVLGGGPNGGPRVRTVSGESLLAAGPFTDLDGVAGRAVVADYFAGDPGARGGVRVAFWDTDGDGRGEVVTDAGTAAAADVRSYSAAGLFGDPAAPAVHGDLDALLDVSLFGAAFVG